jgi:hypothetical protein
MSTAKKKCDISVMREENEVQDSSSSEELHRRPWSRQVNAFHQHFQQIKILNMKSLAVEWQEDEQLLKFVAEHGIDNRGVLVSAIKGRSGKQCYERC